VIIRGQDGKQDIGRVELGNMNLNIKYDKLYSIFEKMMKQYSDLELATRSYDYWVQEKSRYVDLDVLNFYEDIDEEAWENDEWILQYQDTPGDEGNDEDLPILRYSEYDFKTLNSIFGDHLNGLLKDWFEKTYNHKVKTVENY
jgi:hypothetical protein